MIFRRRYSQRILDLEKSFKSKDIVIFEKTVET